MACGSCGAARRRRAEAAAQAGAGAGEGVEPPLRFRFTRPDGVQSDHHSRADADAARIREGGGGTVRYMP